MGYVYNLYQIISIFEKDDYQEDSDWGRAWANFENFEAALKVLKESSNGLSLLINDICKAETKYADKMRSIASSHLNAYQRKLREINA